MKKRIQSLAIAASAMTAATTQAFAIVVDKPETSFYFDDVGKLISGVLEFVMVLGALLVFLYLIWGGIEWITSGGDKGKTESARNKITSAIIGLIVLASSWAILMLVLGFLGTSIEEVFGLIGN